MNTSIAVPSFRGDYAWLSNFAPCQIRLKDGTYPTVEHAYVACKTLDPAERERVRALATPGAVKGLGRRLTLRPDWDEIKLAAMEFCLRQKFSKEPFRSLLLATGAALIEEGNTWGDRYWGVCQGTGQNHLGVLLMKIRDDLRQEPPR